MILAKLEALWHEEAGEALTQNGMFLGMMAVVGYGIYHYAGSAIMGYWHMLATTMPPSGPATGFR